MPLRFATPLSFLAALVLLGVAPLISAQVELNLTTAQQGNCVAVTDAQGLQLEPNGTGLQATGVTFSGTGCGGGAGGDFQATVTAPPSAVAAIPFNVAWSASAQATQCTFGGASVAGWPAGQTACQGTTCAGAHVAAVTVPAAGNYAFSMTCTNASGYAQGLTAATGGAPLPPTPNPFALSAPTTSIANASFLVSWAVSGATSCTGSASLNGSSVNLPGWNDRVDTASPRTVTPSVAGTYVLNMHCDNASGSAVSNPATVVITPANTDSCPAGRQTQATICYQYTTAGNSCAVNSDVTKFENIWGRYWINSGSISSPPQLFPGVNYYAVIANLNANGYIAAKFTMPAGLPSNQLGILSHGETLAGPNLTMSISPSCGDFAPSPPICLYTDRGPPSAIGKWKPTSNNAAVACPLTPGQTYFMNLKITTPSTCAGTSCTVSTQNNHSP